MPINDRNMLIFSRESNFLVLFTSVIYTLVPGFYTSEILKNGAKELNDDNFSDNTKSKEWSLVLFYRNWCTRSKKVMNELNKAVNFMGTNSDIFWGKIDCESEGLKTCEKFSVSNVPAIYLFKKGNYFKEFMDQPDFAGIVRYVKAETGPGYSILNNDEESRLFFSGREVKIVGSFKPESNLKKSFLGLVNEWKHQIDFAVTLSDVIEGEEEITLHRPLHLENKFEDSSVKYTGSTDVNELESWIISNKHGLVGHRHKYNTVDFKEPLVVVYYDVDYERAAKITNYWRNRVFKVAEENPDFTFAISSTKDFQKEMVNFGHNFMRPAVTPLACAYNKSKRYPMAQDFSVLEFVKFVEDFKSGNIEPHMRSEELPESNNGPVIKAVAKNFDELVSESGKDALIKFYAPWCTWCKRLAPVWDELGKAMKLENVDIIKYNAEANEIPQGYEVNGYPTLYWVGKDSKQSPVTYQGGRDFEDFIKYIAKHATEELQGYDRKGVSKTATTGAVKEDL